MVFDVLPDEGQDLYVVIATWGEFYGDSWHEAYWAALAARPR